MLLLSLILAHLIADFFLQSDEMVNKKQKYLPRHIFHHFTLNILLLTAFWVFKYQSGPFLPKVLYPLTLITVTHFLIDLLKIKLTASFSVSARKSRKLLYVFLMDQLLHLAVLVLSGAVFFQIDAIGTLNELYINHNAHLELVNSLLFIGIITILATNVSGHILNLLLGSLPNQLLTFEGRYAYKNEWTINQKNEKGISEEYLYSVYNKHDLSRGKLIGYIERLLVILLTYYNAFPAIGFIVAAKSIARFKQMDDRDWAEYFLLGTLSSMFLGITLGIILKGVLL